MAQQKKFKWLCLALMLLAGVLLSMLSPMNRLSGEELIQGDRIADEVRQQDGSKAKKSGGSGSEEEIFGDENTITPSDKVTDDALSTAIEKPAVVFGGFLNARNSGYYKRSSVLRVIDVIGGNNFLSYIQGNFSLDARLLKGIKGYVNFSADYYPAGIPKSRSFQVPMAYLGIPAYFTKADLMVAEKVNAAFSLNEIFVDVNFDKRLYLRIGKQTLKWGTGFLWTPTDLINIEKKNILDSSQVRQGSYGLKVHVPFGTRANIYSFIDLNRARNVSDISMANKVEILLKNTEVALSVLLKKKNVPVYGLDFTTRILTLDVHGEASLSYGENKRTIRVYPWYLAAGSGAFPVENLFLFSGNSSVMDQRIKGKWIPKASFGFGRGFEVKDVKDRIRFDVEGFYNHTGYKRNIFEKDIITTGYFLTRGLYDMNYYGKYYAGLFLTVRQMFVEELSAMINCMVNIGDQSSVISGMISYAPFYDLTFNLMVNGFVGKENREYTVFGNYVTGELSVKIVF